MTVERIIHIIEKCQRVSWTREFPVVGEYALHRRTGVLGKVRVLTS